MVAPRVSRFPTAGQGERRLWERDCGHTKQDMHLTGESSSYQLTCTDCTDRYITDDDQSPTDNPQQPAISYDLITIDDVSDEALHADADCNSSGLLRQTPKGERENPEGMEHDVTSACFNKAVPAHVDTEDNSESFLEDSVEFDDHWNSNKRISDTDSSFTQPAEVLVKTTWSIKNIFRRQKSLPPPDHKLGALKQ